MKKYILALDQGTTSSRAVLINHHSHVIASASKEFPQLFPQPGWVEHNPNDIWSTQAAVIAEVIAKGGIAAEEIAAIGVTNQRETTVVWDRKTGAPIAPAIVWQDRRTTLFCQELKGKGLESLFKHKTGLLLDPYFSGTKLHWLLSHVPGAREKAKRGELAFGTIDSWLVWKLTGGEVHTTDPSNASRTLLYNIHTLDWDQDILAILDIPLSLLPSVNSSSGVHAMTKTPLLSCPIPISGIAGDQQAALFGQACFHPGMVKTTYGTGCFLLMNTGTTPVMSKHNLLTTIAYQLEGKTCYALEGSVFIGGAVVQWLRDGLGLIRKSADIEPLASRVTDSEGVYFVPAFTGLGAPHWDPHATGTILGITRGTTASHLARAALEGIAFQVMDVLEAMEKDAGIHLKELRVDGGVVASELLMQFQADLIHAPVLRPKVTELTALGAGYLAGLAVGFWSHQNEIAHYWQLERTFTPCAPQALIQEKKMKWNKAVRAAQFWGELNESR